jgi:hypothetical protein
MNDDAQSRAAAARAVSDSDEAFFQAIRARMPESSRRVIDRLQRVKSVYVDCGRDKLLRMAFDRFLESFLATRNGRRDEASVFFLTGASGAGKSEAVAHVLHNHPALQPMATSFGAILPHVSVKLSGFTLPRLAAGRIIAAAGYPIRHDTKRGEVWDTMAARLKARRTFLVHVDETQHLIKQNASQNDREDLANAIKGVSIDKDWPVAFWLTGLPSVTELPLSDEQFERRGNFVHFPDVAMPDERKLVVRILRQLCEAGEITLGSLPEGDLPERIAHAARYRYARICQVVVAALHEALHGNADVLLRDHFALAYAHHSQARGHNDMNPFIVDDWARLAPGSFLLRNEEEDGR